MADTDEIEFPVTITMSKDDMLAFQNPEIDPYFFLKDAHRVTKQILTQVKAQIPNSEAEDPVVTLSFEEARIIEKALVMLESQMISRSSRDYIELKSLTVIRDALEGFEEE